ncbi:cobalamin biosynthesis protein CobD (plasmid) [Thermaerobacter sp. FW80]|uniref:adenosylcobinamide-phosphate synthase CbiB n=1 Tax=Thermaerobacter sp. FW80 TaxID=2546351 RepID=UPI001075196F|nr:adenosylcobinamide-phosphate synthase CbiB [Thermaerobacter sp. FW80]QBS38693.1 cobalamin biosynthesis protein CobD [Thermaerobacter sp. FW80]
MTATDRVVPLLLALLLDALWGEPPNRWHPVAWMGTGIGAASCRAPSSAPGRLAYGAAVVVAGAVAAAGAGLVAERLLATMPRALAWVAAAVVLKTTFSARRLAEIARQVHAVLAAGDVCQARCLVGYHLVSRDTRGLDAPRLAAATIESVAENASDSVVAPLFYYVLAGLPGALAYRFLNTADAMLGYRDPSREWLGKAAARADDAANLIPARLTAALLVLAAACLREDARGALSIWRQDAGKTASPNAGHPMSAMAGALGVELEKAGHYKLGAGLALPGPSDIERAVRLFYGTVAMAIVLACAVIALRA